MTTRRSTGSHHVKTNFGVARCLVMCGLGGLVGAVVASACASVVYPVVAFRCDPKDGVDRACPEGFFCCSDDPAATNGALPNFAGREISGGGTPLFAGARNNVSRRGMCVDLTEIDPLSALQDVGAQNCPIPCNPTWEREEIELVCGVGAQQQCCQTVPLGTDDCVFDLDLEIWRPAVGTDVNSLRVQPMTGWSTIQHETHQDPGGVGCMSFTGDAFRDCVAQLTVADQRGFCRTLAVGEACDAAGMLNACEEINMMLRPPPGN